MDQGNLVKGFNEAAFTLKKDVIGTVDDSWDEKYRFEWNVISPYQDVFNGNRFEKERWQRENDRDTVLLNVFHKDDIRGYRLPQR